MKKRRTKRGLAILSAALMTFSVLSSVMVSALPVKAAATVSNPRIADDGTVTWDKVTFGNYPQDAEFNKEPIKWRILDIDDAGNAFLLADKGLDYCGDYNEVGVEKTGINGDVYTDYTCTWETCTLRKWLNGIGTYLNDESSFIKAAFTDEEREAIIPTQVNNADDDNGGNNTEDKIYLLSKKEVENINYGFKSDGDSDESRLAEPTDYAIINGVEKDKYSNKYCEWWLRSYCYSFGYNATFVSDSGYVCDGAPDDYGNHSVRPVLHVNLSHVKDAGKVTSEGEMMPGSNRNSSDYSKPTTEANVTTWDCVYFGSYKQNANLDKKPIEWRVLSVNGNDAFLLADKALDHMNKYNYGEWETNSIRYWLNGTNEYASDGSAFINAAFTGEEREAILSTNVINADNNRDGNNTVDNIYLLSKEEALNSAYGFDEIEVYSKTRQAKTTDYAILNGAWFRNYDGDEFVERGNCHWWLRSKGDLRAQLSVNESGSINTQAFSTNVVRPVLHVNLSTAYVSNAGTVSAKSDLNVEKRSAAKVVNIISLIGIVTKDSKAKIEEARLAYNALSDAAKAKVSNYSILENAEKKYAELLKEESAKGVVTSQEPVVVATTEQIIMVPDKVKITSAKNKIKKSVVVKWKQTSNAKGYEIQYSHKKKFTKKCKKVSTDRLTFTIKKLKRNKKYLIRVRAYNQGTDGKKVYGKWSDVKKVKIKK